MTLVRILNWNHYESDNIWVKIENDMAGHNFTHAPWVLAAYRSLLEGVSPLTATLKIWDRVNRMVKLPPAVSQLAPLGGFPWFVPGEDISFFGTWGSGTDISCGVAASGGNLLTLAELI